MKIFRQRELKEAIAHALEGHQALHLHRIIVNRGAAPKCFVRDVDAGNAGKMPFEDRVLAYLREHDGQGKTYEDAAKAIGICEAAIYVAVANLEAKGIVAHD